MRTQEEKIAEVEAQIELVNKSLEKVKRKIDKLPAWWKYNHDKLKEYLSDYSRLELEKNRLVNLLNVIK